MKCNEQRGLSHYLYFSTSTSCLEIGRRACRLGAAATPDFSAARWRSTSARTGCDSFLQELIITIELRVRFRDRCLRHFHDELGLHVQTATSLHARALDALCN